MTETTERPNVNYGDEATARANVILRTTVGSGVHGVAIEGTDDHDEMGVFIEPPEYVLGVSAWSYVHDHKMHTDGHGMPNFTWRTKPDGVRSGPGDTDLSMYSLRKYARLAGIGNPTVLLPLWAPDKDVLEATDLGEELRSLRALFMSQHAVHRFLRYMENQHERMLGGGRQGRVPNRPELVAKHGWDVKYGSHALRLAYEGHEVATTGRLTLPMRDVQRETVLSVKRGEVSRDQVSTWITNLTAKTQEVLDEGTSPLPEEPDWDNINGWLQMAHIDHWRSHGLL